MDFPPHQRPNVSRLETYRSEIVAMRSSKWPFLKIAAWLNDQHQITVSKEAVRQFCKVRSIRSISSTLPPSSNSTMPIEPKKTSTKFEFDESKPILTRRNEPQ